MSTSTGYRAFPPEIHNPSTAKLITESEFLKFNAKNMQEAPSACQGHTGTTVWYANEKGYFIQIKFSSKPSVFIPSICTFTPTLGMDKIDGLFAQDAEEYILNKELGYKTDRLSIFKERQSVPVQEYLKYYGVIK